MPEVQDALRAGGRFLELGCGACWKPPCRCRPARDARRRLAEERAAALEELDRARQQFVATASHDLKTPLTAIRGYAQLLLRRVRGPAPDLQQVADGLAVIDAKAAALARLMDELLD